HPSGSCSATVASASPFVSFTTVTRTSRSTTGGGDAGTGAAGRAAAGRRVAVPVVAVAVAAGVPGFAARAVDTGAGGGGATGTMAVRFRDARLHRNAQRDVTARHLIFPKGRERCAGRRRLRRGAAATFTAGNRIGQGGGQRARALALESLEPDLLHRDVGAAV